MQSFDPKLFHVPTGYIELRRALKLTVERLFRPKYTAPLRAVMAEFRKKTRQRRWEAAEGLLLKALRAGSLNGYLRQDDAAIPLDRAHWNQWGASWRPFEQDVLGVRDAPVCLLRCEEWDRWTTNKRRCVDV